MKVFNNINKNGRCKICGTNDEGECCLIPVDGTQEDGIAEARQVHIKCLELWLDSTESFIFMNI